METHTHTCITPAVSVIVLDRDNYTPVPGTVQEQTRIILGGNSVLSSLLLYTKVFWSFYQLILRRPPQVFYNKEQQASTWTQVTGSRAAFNLVDTKPTTSTTQDLINLVRLLPSALNSSSVTQRPGQHSGTTLLQTCTLNSPSPSTRKFRMVANRKALTLGTTKTRDTRLIMRQVPTLLIRASSPRLAQEKPS